MGAEQSSTNGSREGGRTSKTCYYEVLEVNRDASQDEIKCAYRKKALELHPDRNYGQVEEATLQFTEVQAAYDVLSDPQERAWYDSHREVILSGGDVRDEDHFEDNVGLTTEKDILFLMSRFSRRVPFSDAPNGFYGILRATFRTLAEEEDAACEREGLIPHEFPDFGTSDDDFHKVVRPFYNAWAGFSTSKSYSWKAIHRVSDISDRRTRRAVEKENQRLCDEGIRNFNDAVRSLVSFSRKRDHRYINNLKSDADREKELQEAAAKQAAQARAANRAKLDNFVLPSWAQGQSPPDEKLKGEKAISGEEGESSEENENDIPTEIHYECVICDKTFKSLKQCEVHEKSRKHIKAVQQLEREINSKRGKQNGERTKVHIKAAQELEEHIRAEDKAASFEPNSNENNNPHQSLPTSNLEKEELKGDIASADAAESGRNQIHGPSDRLPDPGMEATPSDSEIQSDSDILVKDYLPRNEIEKKFSNLNVKGALSDHANNRSKEEKSPIDSGNSREPRDSIPKLGKAKLKRAKKAARQESKQDTDLKCKTCNQEFPSKTQLFSHVYKTNHATAITSNT